MGKPWRSRAVRLVIATTYLYLPGFMIFIWFRYMQPDDPGTGFDLVFLAMFSISCWYGFGWFFLSVRRALSRDDDDNGR